MYFKAFKRYIPVAITGIVLIATVVVIELNQIDYMGRIINEGVVNRDLGIVFRYGLIMVGMALLAAFFGVLGVFCASVASNGFAINLREMLYQKIQAFSVKNVTRFQTASLITRLTNDVNFLQQTIMMSLRMLVRAPMMLVASFIFIYRSSQEIATIMIVPILFLTIGLLILISKGYSRFVRLQDKLDNVNRRVQEALINIRVIKSFVREDYEDDRFDVSNKEYRIANISAQNLMVVMVPLMMLALNGTMIAVLYASSYLVLETQVLQLGNIVVILNYIRFTLFSLIILSQILVMVSRAKASVQRISEVLEADEPISNIPQTKTLKHVSGEITFNNVTFRYYDDQLKDTLKNIDLTIRPGEKFGIIGSTGSGKTTLVNLIGRLIDPSEGSILLDGVDIRELDLHRLRSYFGFVPQKNVLFSGTIKDNLRLGNETLSEKQLDKITKTASIHEFIMDLPGQYDNVLTQGGSNLSGGQKQRMCIARALAVNPKVLIMDDSTSALDADTEGKIKEALNRDLPEMTIISIAQKISSVATSDRILVIDDGEVVGLDTHKNLMENNRIYQEIYQSQMEKGATA